MQGHERWLEGHLFPPLRFGQVDRHFHYLAPSYPGKLRWVHKRQNLCHHDQCYDKPRKIHAQDLSRTRTRARNGRMIDIFFRPFNKIFPYNHIILSIFCLFCLLVTVYFGFFVDFLSTVYETVYLAPNCA